MAALKLEPAQTDLLERVCGAPLLPVSLAAADEPTS